MKAPDFARALLAATALALFPAGADAGDLHHGKGTLLRVDVEGRWILLMEGSGETHALLLDPRTRVVDETGRPISATALQPGDLVREECQLLQGDDGVAREIRLLRPAWMEIASPES